MAFLRKVTTQAFDSIEAAVSRTYQIIASLVQSESLSTNPKESIKSDLAIGSVFSLASA